jgi:hypothetical protein
MVDHVMEIVEQDGNFDSVFLHVQVRFSQINDAVEAA